MKIKTLALLISLSGIAISCNDFLEKTPKSDIQPENYFDTGEQLLTYTTTLYPDFIVTHSSISGNNAGTFILDNDTDNQADRNPSEIWTDSEYKVPTRKGEWNFSKIDAVNFFFQQVLPKYEEGKILGYKTEINQALGEAYFFRALAYFEKLKSIGDYPIIKEVMPEDREILRGKSKRKPRNEVARFILEDLDKAIEFLPPGPVANKNRISKEVAQLVRSNVALFEGTWLKYHKGTAFVPGGPGWPGAKLYPDFTLDIDNESNYFLREAMKSAEVVADKIPLTPNNGKTKNLDVFTNPYFMMFSDINMSQYSEVLLWKDYSVTYGQVHTVQSYLRVGANSGYTRGFVDTFLMKDGLPIYASNLYKGDDYIRNVHENRDQRLQLFMKNEGDVLSSNGAVVFNYPDILGQGVHSSTGYDIKKGTYPDAYMMSSANIPSYTGSLVYRATEAYLNYIEAQYELEHNLNGKALNYWRQIRQRAGVDTDVNKTITATDLSQENDWAVYSKGEKVDKTLYNIRRERRCELIAEGARMDDLKRWRSLDQITGAQIEGFKLWGPMREWYGKLLESSQSVSKEKFSKYLRINQIQDNKENIYLNGLKFPKAHYLSPISEEELQLASPTGAAGESNIYQNPGWPTYAGGVATL